MELFKSFVFINSTIQRAQRNSTIQQLLINSTDPKKTTYRVIYRTPLALLSLSNPAVLAT
jgi:hypothetical protein